MLVVQASMEDDELTEDGQPTAGTNDLQSQVLLVASLYIKSVVKGVMHDFMHGYYMK